MALHQQQPMQSPPASRLLAPITAPLPENRLRESKPSGVNGRSMRNSAIAGYAAGSFGVIFGYPLDSAKVWIQTNTKGKNKHLGGGAGGGIATAAASSSSTKSVGMVPALKRPLAAAAPIGATAPMSTLAAPVSSVHHTFRNATNTIRALYSGACGPLLTVGIVQSINFTTYDAVRRLLHQKDHPGAAPMDYLNHDSLWNCALAGWVAGSGLAVITSPLVMIKNRQQITGLGFRQALRDSLCGTNGRLSLNRCFVGFAPHYGSEAFGRALYYTAYEGCKRTIADYRQGGSVTLGDRMASAGLAGILCWAAIFPMDTLRSRLYSQEGPRRLSTTEMARQLWREGVLYRGFGLTVLRAGPVAAAVLPVYDLVLEKLSS